MSRFKITRLRNVEIMHNMFLSPEGKRVAKALTTRANWVLRVQPFTINTKEESNSALFLFCLAVMPTAIPLCKAKEVRWYSGSV